MLHTGILRDDLPDIMVIRAIKWVAFVFCFLIQDSRNAGGMGEVEISILLLP